MNLTANRFNAGKKRVMASLIWLGRRAVVFYILVYLLSHFAVDYGRINFGLKVKKLIRYMPREFQYLLALEEGSVKPELKLLEEYLQFYRVVVEQFPERADARGMLGFCEFYAGNPEAALFQYQKAGELKPQVFWFFYNPAVIYFKAGRPQEALRYFQQALAADPVETGNYVANSKVIHRVFFRDVSSLADELKGRLKIGYQNAYILTVSLYYEQQDYHHVLQTLQDAIRAGVKRQDLFYYYAGLTYLRLKQYQHAQTAFERSLTLNADFYESAYFLAGTLQALGDEEGYQEASRKAASLEGSKTRHLPHLSKITLRLF